MFANGGEGEHIGVCSCTKFKGFVNTEMEEVVYSSNMQRILTEHHHQLGSGTVVTQLSVFAGIRLSKLSRV